MARPRITGGGWTASAASPTTFSATHLPELSFRDISPGALDATLAQVARTDLSLLDIHVPSYRHRFSPARVASLLRAAARLAPAELSLVVWGMGDQDRPAAVEMPCFHRATSLRLGGWWLAMALPEQQGQGAVFPVLERLSIDAWCFDFGDLIPRCPRLRQLEVTRAHGIGAVTVRSPTIESLHVDGLPLRGMGIDVVAPRPVSLHVDALPSEVKGFVGAEHEVDLLKLILRCAPMLKVMTLTLSDEVSPCIAGCVEIYRVLKAHHSVKWCFNWQPQ
ncbi:hypothetical protein HU200_010233 [Digitaria exilis]|uniref:Uncharacterized protein n=1 Tax=Digitaria exilis TaxID=1010633 RepID=A0A835FIX8_9POAL|nr:hypothetical protein HU200_010233 [Digitaria exilis]